LDAIVDEFEVAKLGLGLVFQLFVRVVEYTPYEVSIDAMLEEKLHSVRYGF